MSLNKTPKSYGMVKNLLLENTPLCQDVINLIGVFVGNTVFKVGDEYLVDEAALYDADVPTRYCSYNYFLADDESFPDECKKTVTVISRTKFFCNIRLKDETVIKVKIFLTDNQDEYFQIKVKSNMENMLYIKKDKYFVMSNRKNRGIEEKLYKQKYGYCSECDIHLLEKSMKAHQNSKKHKKNIK